jgi:hypothetical protein
MILQLIDDDGKTVLFEADLGQEEGQWDIHNADEAGQLIAAIQRQAE